MAEARVVPQREGGRSQIASFIRRRTRPARARSLSIDGRPPHVAPRSPWRLVVGMAMAVGALTFLGSFVIPPSYEARSRLLVRSRDATVLSSTGDDLGSQPGIVDSTLGASLVNTQIAVLGSHQMSVGIVDRLGLDRRPEPTGPVAQIKRAVAGSVKRTRAYLIHGMYREPTQREAAIQEVAEGLRAAAVGESFVLEVVGAGGSPEDAQAITDTAADLLLETSTIRTRAESEAHQRALRKQLDDAYTAQADAELAISNLKGDRSIANLDASQVLSETGVQELRSALNTTQASIEEVTARLSATKSQLAKTPKTVETTSEIQTGRSSTEVSNSGTNATYTTLLNSSQAIEAELAGLRAKSQALSRILSATPATSSRLPSTEADLRLLELKREVAAGVVRTISSQYEAATSRAELDAVELTRLDAADLPLYPAAPKRWMYLLLGLTLGGLAGFLASYRRMVRAGFFGSSTRILDNDWNASNSARALPVGDDYANPAVRHAGRHGNSDDGDDDGDDDATINLTEDLSYPFDYGSEDRPDHSSSQLR